MVTTSIVGLVVSLWVVITGSGSSLVVIFRLVVGGSVEHRAGAIASASHLHGLVVSWDQCLVETVIKIETHK